MGESLFDLGLDGCVLYELDMAISRVSDEISFDFQFEMIEASSWVKKVY